MDPVTILTIAGPTALVTAGAAFATVKTTLNGTKERVRIIEEELTAHKADTIDRLARIETKLDMLVEEL